MKFGTVMRISPDNPMCDPQKIKFLKSNMADGCHLEHQKVAISHNRFTILTKFCKLTHIACGP